VSADHLEHATNTDLEALSKAGVVGVILPGASLVLGGPPPPGRRLLDAGCTVAVATELQSGNLLQRVEPLMVALAVALGGLTPAQALVAATAGGAAALGLADRGILRAGMRLRRGDPQGAELDRRRVSPRRRHRGQRDPRGTVGSTLEGLMLTESSRRTRPGRRGGAVLPRLVGQDLEVQLAGGERRTYVNLDMAASTPAMEAVADAVIEFLPWYSSVHRGAGFASQVSTRAYEAARSAVAAFAGARSSDAVIFVRNTTEAITS